MKKKKRNRAAQDATLINTRLIHRQIVKLMLKIKDLERRLMTLERQWNELEPW